MPAPPPDVSHTLRVRQRRAATSGNAMSSSRLEDAHAPVSAAFPAADVGADQRASRHAQYSARKLPLIATTRLHAVAAGRNLLCTMQTQDCLQIMQMMISF